MNRSQSSTGHAEGAIKVHIKIGIAVQMLSRFFFLEMPSHGDSVQLKEKEMRWERVHILFCYEKSVLIDSFEPLQA